MSPGLNGEIPNFKIIIDSKFHNFEDLLRSLVYFSLLMSEIFMVFSGPGSDHVGEMSEMYEWIWKYPPIIGVFPRHPNTLLRRDLDHQNIPKTPFTSGGRTGCLGIWNKAKCKRHKIKVQLLVSYIQKTPRSTKRGSLGIRNYSQRFAIWKVERSLLLEIHPFFHWTMMMGGRVHLRVFQTWALPSVEAWHVMI